MPSITSPVGYRRKEDLSSSPRIKSGEPSNCSTSEERKKSIHLLMFQIPMNIRGSFNSTATCGVHYFTLVPTGKVTDRHQMSKLVKEVEPVTGNVSEFSHSEPQLLWGSREVLVLWKPPWDRICLSERLLLFPSNTAELAGLALPKHYVAGKNLQSLPSSVSEIGPAPGWSICSKQSWFFYETFTQGRNLTFLWRSKSLRSFYSNTNVSTSYLTQESRRCYSYLTVLESSQDYSEAE